ncbi:hypothetical protein [Planococcus sp. CAU13]|uniref:hypothetical protein n=1 Tax=Planococcus sp. CAU13 TaxID=1541197 RepID=UPI00052FE422|nr:hypothetical protein [Planococcus sp. CAU13]
MTTMLTCFNEDLQRFNGRMRFNTQRKQEIIDSIENKMYAMGKSFRKLFTPKKREVLDEIAYLLTGSGICTIGTDKLMQKCGIKSRTTVVEAVRAMKESGDILVCRLANNHAGKYVFVLKTHPNFEEIMEQVFHIHPTDTFHAIEHQNEHQSEHQNEHLQNSEVVDALSVNQENPSPIYSISFNLLNLLKQDSIHNIANHIDNELLNAKKNEQESLRIDEYLSERQKAFYEQIKNNEDLLPVIRDNASLIALRIAKKYYPGLVQKSLYKMNEQLHLGKSIESIPAYFVECCSNLMKKGMDKNKLELEYQPGADTGRRKPAPKFYNWLEDIS